jgi:hypothetical protein
LGAFARILTTLAKDPRDLDGINLSEGFVDDLGRSSGCSLGFKTSAD